MASQTPRSSSPDDTADFLDRFRGGDREALDMLFSRHTTLLRRWAAGRLPRWARGAIDTVDLVQDTMMATLKTLDRFEVRGEGALQAYLRQALINKVHTQVRKANSRPVLDAADSGIVDDGTSPVEAAIGREKAERYEAALARLPDDTRAAVVARVEMGLSYAEIATVLDKPSADAVRMVVARALVKLAREMSDVSPTVASHGQAGRESGV
jgi:RNA polymerase sigma-70 factor (ECF subfamily)